MRSQLALSAISLLLLFPNPSHAAKKEKLKPIDLQTITSLTFHRGRHTTSRRGKPVLQIVCVGGDACEAFVPEVIQCKNAGFDGRDVQWKCEAEVEDGVRLGTTDVSCEGWSGPEDEKVVSGSCGVEYTLHFTVDAKARMKQSEKSEPLKPEPEQHKHTGDDSADRLASNLFFFFAFMIVAYVVVRCFSQPSRGRQSASSRRSHPDDSDDRPGFGGGPGSGGGGGGDEDDPPPPYSPRGVQPEESKPSSFTAPPPTSTSSTSSAGSAWGRPGFWSSAGLGYLAGDFMGSRREQRRQAAYVTPPAQTHPFRPNPAGQAPPPRTAQSTFNSIFGSPSSSSSTSGPSKSSSSTSWASYSNRNSTSSSSSSWAGSGGTHSSSGYGGTKRR